MKRVATMVRCVPRFGFADTDVRTVDLDLPADYDESVLHEQLERWFAHKGIAEAVFAIEYDDNGPFAVVNDEAFDSDWGTPIL